VDDPLAELPPDFEPLPALPDDAPRDDPFLSGELPMADAIGGIASATAAANTAR